MFKNIFMIIITFLIGFLGFMIFINNISKCFNELRNATSKISHGEMSYRLKNQFSVLEFNQLAASFNKMVDKLEIREEKLNITNEKLQESNKRNLDLIGFVAHELKGILSSTMINAYTIRDGYLGMINFKQRKALDSISRNIDYLDATIKNFLNLTRIEKNEIQINCHEFMYGEEVVDMSIEAFERLAEMKHIILENKVPKGLLINADKELLIIVMNNLVSNAIKYGSERGRVTVSSEIIKDRLEIHVYNDGIPISQENIEKLFGKFSRLDTPETRRSRGTGLGLFVTKQIIAQHNGVMSVRAEEKGNTFIFNIERGIHNVHTA